MILKPGKNPTVVFSYRPISLISNLAKLLEKIINTRLTTYLEENNLISIHQSGFRKNRSTQDHIFRLRQDVKSNFNQNKLTGAILFDFSKAFDRTWHKGIVFKLYKIKVPLYLCAWINNFLENRLFYVYINNYKSMQKSINSGVPQGSTISPTLFSFQTLKTPN